MRKMEEETQAYQERYNQNEEEVQQIKEDMQVMVNYKNDLELLIDEQTQNLTMTSKRANQMEEQLRSKQNEFDSLEATLRRANESAAESKKKLLQAEVKLRQLTGATVKDLKMSIKQKQNEIDVLKEMVRASSGQLKQKDNDISHLHERVQILEKLVEINQNLKGLGFAQGGAPPSGQTGLLATDNLNIMSEKGFGEQFIPQDTSMNF